MPRTQGRREHGREGGLLFCTLTAATADLPDAKYTKNKKNPAKVEYFQKTKNSYVLKNDLDF